MNFESVFASTLQHICSFAIWEIPACIWMAFLYLVKRIHLYLFKGM